MSDSTGKDQKGYGFSPEKPFKTIAYALHKDRRVIGQTIHIMNGTYRNKDFGTGNKNNPVVVNLNGVTDLVIKNYMRHTPVIEFDGAGGFVGGSVDKPVINLEISGLEIKGPNSNINFAQAMANRLNGQEYFSGRGVGIWNGHHIYIHDLKVHDCPNSGIRVNNGDYVIIENCEVYRNTWWAPSAESAIVLATSKNIDKKDIIKMIIRHNKVYDNVNKIPYYNSKYKWNESPIGEGANCKKYKECEQGLMSCPWSCRYGKKTQDYIIDGQGVYVTRNSDTYLYGRMELSYNTAYRNGINGVVFHRTHRGVVKNNLVYENGVVPKAGHKEPKVEDWHKGCSGKTRQPYSGIVLNEAEHVELYDNQVAARYSDDYAYKMQMDKSHQEYTVIGSNNWVCTGIAEIVPDSIFKRHFCHDITLYQGGQMPKVYDVKKLHKENR